MNPVKQQFRAFRLVPYGGVFLQTEKLVVFNTELVVNKTVGPIKRAMFLWLSVWGVE